MVKILSIKKHTHTHIYIYIHIWKLFYQQNVVGPFTSGLLIHDTSMCKEQYVSFH